jgi:hypothetical protein
MTGKEARFADEKINDLNHPVSIRLDAAFASETSNGFIHSH